MIKGFRFDAEVPDDDREPVSRGIEAAAMGVLSAYQYGGMELVREFLGYQAKFFRDLQAKKRAQEDWLRQLLDE